MKYTITYRAKGESPTYTITYDANCRGNAEWHLYHDHIQNKLAIPHSKALKIEAISQE